MVIWKPNPYVICPHCNRVNYLKGGSASGLLCKPPEPEVLECGGCERSQFYCPEDMLPVIPERDVNDNLGCRTGYRLYSVYLIVNTCNGLIYVGRTTKSLFERMSQYEAHCRRLKPNMIASWSNPILLAMSEFGFKAFDMMLLEEVLFRAVNEDRERYWIRRLDARNPLKGYNCV